MIFLIPGIAFPLISGFSGASTLILTLTLASAETFSKIVFLISSSARFLICIAGVCKTNSTTTSSPKVSTLVTAPLSTIFFPSPAIVIVSKALRISFLSNFITKFTIFQLLFSVQNKDLFKLISVPILSGAKIRD